MIHTGEACTPRQLKAMGCTKSYPDEEGRYVFCQDNRRIIWSPIGSYSGQSKEDDQEGKVVNVVEMKHRCGVPGSA